jgi:hypothetical protein
VCLVCALLIDEPPQIFEVNGKSEDELAAEYSNWTYARLVRAVDDSSAQISNDKYIEYNSCILFCDTAQCFPDSN